MFRRLLRAVFNRWTLTVLMLISWMEAAEHPAGPLAWGTLRTSRFCLGRSYSDWYSPLPSWSLWLSTAPLQEETSQWSQTTIYPANPWFKQETHIGSFDGHAYLLPTITLCTTGGSPNVHLMIPSAGPALIVTLWAGYLHGRARSRGKIVAGVCRKCGYPTASLTADAAKPNTVTCPECGTLNSKV
jgi:hypothetical protein